MYAPDTRDRQTDRKSDWQTDGKHSGLYSHVNLTKNHPPDSVSLQVRTRGSFPHVEPLLISSFLVEF